MFVVYQTQLNTLFWDVSYAVKEKKYEKAGSGRIAIWSDTLHYYDGLSVDQQVLGVGLGYEKKSIFKKEKFFVAKTHNDYLGLLITTGAMGLFMYLFIMVLLLCDILLYRGDLKLKYIYLAFLCSVLAMNMGSNSYVSRVEMAQLFWVFMGTFYAVKKIGYDSDKYVVTA